MKLFAKTMVLLLTIGLLSACHKDDNIDEPQPEPEKSQQTASDTLAISNKYTTIATLMSNLTGITKLESDFASKRYEPTYGQADNEAATSRTVVLETVEEAEADFRNLIGKYADDIVSTTPDGISLNLNDIPTKTGETFSFGTLTFHRGDGSANLGYVEVNIPAIPHLERIEYKSATAIGDNASSPYLEGDVVFCHNRDYYCTGFYLCVKAYGSGEGVLVHFCVNEPGGDETINLDGDDEGCWYPYNVSKGHTATLSDIKAYADFILQQKGKLELVKNYLNGDLSEKPLASGKMWHLFPEGFNNNSGVVFKSSDGRGARIRFNASWYSLWYWFYDERVSHYFEVPYNCNNIFNIKQDEFRYIEDDTWDSHYGEKWNYTMNVIHFTSSPVPGITKEFTPVSGSNIAHKDDGVNASQKHLGWCYADNHRLYENASLAIAGGHTPLGIVVYVSDGSEEGDNITEGYGHGLVMAYRNANRYSTRWNPGSSAIVELDDYIYTQFVNKSTGAAAALSDFKGILKTDYLSDVNSYSAKNASDYSPKVTDEMKTSSWFIPSAAQWIAIMCSPGLGGAKKPSTSDGFPTYMENGSGNPFANINKYINDPAVTRTFFEASDTYWSSSAFNGSVGVYLAGNSTRLTWWNSSSYAFVRPIFAF